MEHSYTSYTKVIDSKTYYFVKKFLVFPELEGIEPILENFGMHTDFEKACSIASVYDPQIRQYLLDEIENNIVRAKVIDLNDVNFSAKRIAGL